MKSLICILIALFCEKNAKATNAELDIQGCLKLLEDNDRTSIQCFEKIVKNSKKNILHEKILAAAYLKFKAYDKAVARCNNLIKDDAKGADQYYQMRANAYSGLKKYNLAVQDISTLINKSTIKDKTYISSLYYQRSVFHQLMKKPNLNYADQKTASDMLVEEKNITNDRTLSTINQQMPSSEKIRFNIHFSACSNAYFIARYAESAVFCNRAISAYKNNSDAKILNLMNYSYLEDMVNAEKMLNSLSDVKSFNSDTAKALFYSFRFKVKQEQKDLSLAKYNLDLSEKTSILDDEKKIYNNISVKIKQNIASR